MTEENPYRTPEAEAVAVQPAERQVPSGILRKIKAGWIATLVLGILNTLVATLAVSGVLDNQLFNEWMFIDAALMFGLAAGIYFKSRTAATIMFFYYLGAKIFLIVMAGHLQGILLTLVLLYFLFMGMVGTYQYHAHLKNEAMGRRHG